MIGRQAGRRVARASLPARTLFASVLLWLAASAAAFAQAPAWPPTLAGNTVMGRLSTTGPAQAIPFSVLATNLLNAINAGTSPITTNFANITGVCANGLLGNDTGATRAAKCLTGAVIRSGSIANIDGITSIGDTNYTILATDRTVVTNAALTAARTWTLPAASAFNAGQQVDIADSANGITSTNTLTLSRAGADDPALRLGAHLRRRAAHLHHACQRALSARAYMRRRRGRCCASHKRRIGWDRYVLRDVDRNPWIWSRRARRRWGCGRFWRRQWYRDSHC